ncbi:MAG: hypothetical protein EOP51_10680 [Sphingobacteriales bacterium]|nr:MAG: hypothetical protein EOP51_10680 [Sphingobacteriales bacterium]
MKCLQTIVLVLLTQICHAQQWDFGGGASVGAPLIYNAYVGSNHHADKSLGAEYIMRYLPPNLSFYPQLTIGISGNEIPVMKYDDLVIQMYLMEIEAILSARLVYNIADGKEFHYGMGLGALYYQSEGVSIAIKGNDLGFYTSNGNDVSGWQPAANVSCEYINKISKKKPAYCGLGFRLGYTYFSNTSPTLNAGISSPTIPGTQITVGPKGNMVTPLLHLSFYYRLGERLY